MESLYNLYHEKMKNVVVSDFLLNKKAD